MVFPTIMPANSVSGGYEISNSLRTANASAEVLQKTLLTYTLQENGTTTRPLGEFPDEVV